MNEWNYIAAAYLVTWVVLAGYAVYLRRRSRQAAQAFERAEAQAGGET
ncbi:MAG: CcmD family protein [Gemmatimonadetes bacterium]|nr:CcmD family protein [Gemmatimonadota bacterium]